MEGLFAVFMFAVVTFLASISWDVWSIRRLLDGKRRADKKHPRNVERRPLSRLEGEGERRPGPKITQPIPKVAQRDSSRD